MINGIMARYGCLTVMEHRCLAAMEHEAGIEQVSGLRFGSGFGFGSIDSTSPLRLNPLRPLIRKEQVFKSLLLVLCIFFFLLPTTMFSIEDEIVADEACMAKQMAAFKKQKAELELLQKAAKEEGRWKRAEEERKWKEEE